MKNYNTKGVNSRDTVPDWIAFKINYFDHQIFILYFVGIGDTVPEIREEDIPKLAHYADKEANPLYPVPVLMDAKELEKFYYMLMEKNSEGDC